MYRCSTIILFLVCFLGSANAQTVSLSSDSFVCVNEVITFSHSLSSGTASSYLWDFGDGSSSTQPNPAHSYTAFGSKKVTISLTLTGGATISASKTIMVHDLPTAKFSLGSSVFCQFSQKVCLIDSSTTGNTTNGYASRLILWGEGSQDKSNLPRSQKTICFAQYPNISTYTIVAEVVNDKGCEAKWSSTIAILEDYVPSFRAKVKAAQCNKQEVCFENDSTNPPTNIQTWTWDYNDGTTEKGSWSGNCHFFTTNQSQFSKFVVELKNGCKSEVAKQFKISFPKLETYIAYGDTVRCFPQPFQFSNPVISGANYAWELYDKDTILISYAGYNVVQSVFVPKPEDYFVRLKLVLGGCTEYSRFVKISSVGVLPDFLPLNHNQCVQKDTVYFLNTSLQHPKANPEWFWDFNDSLAAKCFGYTANCNFDSVLNTQHWYLDTGCFYPSLVVRDRTSGCVDSLSKKVSFVESTFAEFTAHIRRPCIGIKTDYGLEFSTNICGGDIRICIDSIASDTTFDKLRSIHYYPSVADKDGWVTVGFEVTTGSNKVYHSADTSDYTYTSLGICKDTIWYHNWFQLFKEPILDFEIQKDTLCLPIVATAAYLANQDSSLSFIKFLWDPKNSITTLKIENDSVPDITHLYTQEGRYDVYLHLEDTNGCYEYGYFPLEFGYLNSFSSDSIVCIGSEVQFKDSIRYWSDPFNYWQYKDVPEKMWWDFGDGNAFQDSSFYPKHSYSSNGKYLVKLASQDANGCTDTTEKWIEVTGVSASIGNKGKTYLCDQIIQFIDSSYFTDTATNDSITSYFWEFGDYSTESFLKDPFHYYTSNGTFNLKHAVTTKAGCTDTALVSIYLLGPEPYFEITSDTVGCVPYTASFLSNSKSASSLIWDMGDSAKTTIYAKGDSAFQFTYTKPGTYYIYLTASDSFYNEDANNKYTCSALFPDTNQRIYEVRRIIVLPMPYVDFLIKEPICVGQETQFLSKSDSIYTQYNWQIENKDTTTTDKSMNYTFDQPGRYSVTHFPTYIPSGPYERACFDTLKKSVNVSFVKSDFNFQKQGICNEYLFTSKAQNYASMLWDFGHPLSGAENSSTMADAAHYYGKDSGNFTVCLIVKNVEQCIDTFCQDVVSAYTQELVPYNVFTPQGDNLNDVYRLKIENTSYFFIAIYSRWGELVFSSNDPLFTWDGLDGSTGKILPEATYFYILHYQFNCETERKTIEGTVDLIR